MRRGRLAVIRRFLGAASPALVALALTLLAASACSAALHAPWSAKRPNLLPSHETSVDGHPLRSGARRTPRALPFSPGEIVVIANEGALEVSPGGALLSRDTHLVGLLSRLGLERATRLGPTPRMGGVGRPGIWTVTSSRPGFDPVGAARALQATGAFRAVSPNYRFGLLSTIP